MDSSDMYEFELKVSFPLPYRVMFLAGLGILGWATNLHGLERANVETVSTLELSSPDAYSSHHRPTNLPSHHSGYRLLFSDSSVFYKPVYRLFGIYALWCFTSWIIFRIATQGGNTELVDVFGYIPGITALVIFVAIVCPFDVLHKRERDMFLLSIRRCISSSGPVYFADVVFADVFTSFAKVLGDVWLSVIMVLPGSTLLVVPPQDGWSRWIVPIIMSLPYLTRLRQCLIEYFAVSNESKRPLFNAIKYTTAFPVIFFSAAQRAIVDDLTDENREIVVRHPLFRLWLMAAAVNSLYSFWWDVTNDWGLELLKPRQQQLSRASPPRALVLPLLHSRSSSLTSPSSGTHPEPSHTEIHHRPAMYPWGLRPVLLYPLPVYPLLIFINLILRLTWSIKLSSHLHSRSSDGSVVIFWLEVAEVIRRWMWVFVRVEWEVVKKSQEPKSQAGHELFNGMIDEEDGEGFEMATSGIERGL